MTAQTTVLGDIGVVDSYHSLNRLEELLRHVASVLEVEEILRLSTERQTTAILRALRQSPTLLVVDNYETVDDDRIALFLHNVPLPSRILVTSRFVSFTCPDLEVLPLGPDAATDLTLEQASTRGVALTRSEAQHLAAACSHLPLAVVWAIARIASGFTFGSVMALLNGSRGELVEFLFSDAVDRVRDQDAFYVLLSVALQPSAASREVSAAMSGLDDRPLERDEAVALLRSFSLLEVDGDRLSMLPIQKRLIAGEIQAEEAFTIAARARQVAALVALLETLNPRQEPSPPQEEFFRELENIRDLLRWLLAVDHFDDAVALGTQLPAFYWAHGLFAELFDLAGAISSPLSERGQWTDSADLHLLVALAYMDQRSSRGMREHLSAVEEAFAHLEARPPGLLETYLFMRGVLDYFDGATAAARTWFDRAIDLATTMGVGWRIAGSVYWLGIIAYEAGNYNSAAGHFNRVVTIAAENEDDRTRSLGYGYLPICMYLSGSAEEAIQLYEDEASIVIQESGQKTSKGLSDLGASEIYLREAIKALQTALPLAVSARDHFEALGRQEMERATRLRDGLRDAVVILAGVLEQPTETQEEADDPDPTG
jgi:tetratricopeptide (TPR) repeat protein